MYEVLSQARVHLLDQACRYLWRMDQPISRIQPYISGLRSDMRGIDGVPSPSIDAGRVSTLVQLARDGDRDAFGDLYVLCLPGVHRLVRFHMPAAGVDDAVSETFLRAWSALPRYRDTGAPFAAWLAGIARHVVADFHRKAGRSEPRAEVPMPPAGYEERVVDRLRTRAAVQRLPKEQRQVIELKFLVGCTNDEVAKAMGKSVGAVNALQWRALASLRQTLESR